jgi:hypothetical protein
VRVVELDDTILVEGVPDFSADSIAGEQQGRPDEVSTMGAAPAVARAWGHANETVGFEGIAVYEQTQLWGQIE